MQEVVIARRLRRGNLDAIAATSALKDYPSLTRLPRFARNDTFPATPNNCFCAMNVDDTPSSGALNRDAIASLLADQPPLLEECPDLSGQLQPNGIDVTVRSVASYSPTAGAAAIGVSDADLVLPHSTNLNFGCDGWLLLPPGHYLVTFNEVVNLPRWLMALGRPRSSLLRMGVTLHTAVWDAGYSGRSQALLVVHNAGGFRLQQDARIAQLIFFPLSAPDNRGYDGRYQRENL